MRVIVVDDSNISTSVMEHILKNFPLIEEIKLFESPEKALEYVKKNSVDIAFLDIEMPKMDGLTLSKKIKEYRPNIYIIFTTSYEVYALEAFKQHVGGYLLKPVTYEAIKKEIDYALNERKIKSRKKLVAKTFGNFEVFCNGNIIKFGRSKAKELLAYLIDRNGASATSGELIGILWEDKKIDKSIKSLYQNVVSEMMKTLRELGIEDIIIKGKNFIAIDTSKIECDYFKFLEGNKEAMASYSGEYMYQYPWGEFTTAYLNSKI